MLSKSGNDVYFCSLGPPLSNVTLQAITLQHVLWFDIVKFIKSSQSCRTRSAWHFLPHLTTPYNNQWLSGHSVMQYQVGGATVW